jgi:steroid delta-isomerase-like uncharacterized protein
MTRQDVETLFTRRRTAFAARDADAFGPLYAPDAVVESPIAGGTVRGRDANVDVLRSFFRAFPDVTFSSDGLLVDGDRVAEESTMTGTDDGGFMGMPATHKPFRIAMICICELRDGVIARERRIYDFTGMLVQIGVLRAKPA